jgi:hypothetical protein
MVLLKNKKSSVCPIIPLDNIVCVYLLCNELYLYPEKLEPNNIEQISQKLSVADVSFVNSEMRDMASCMLQVLPEKEKSAYFLFDLFSILFVNYLLLI